MTTYSNRLYDHFQREKTVFNRVSLLTISSCVFLFFVVQPYLSTQSDLESLASELDEQNERLSNLQDAARLATSAIERSMDFLGDPSEYETLYDEAERWISGPDEMEQTYDKLERRHQSMRDSLPRELEQEWERGGLPNQKVIEYLKANEPGSLTGFQKEDGCFFLLGDEWLVCQVRKALEPARKRLERVLYDRTTTHEYTKKLKLEIDKQRDEFEEGLVSAMEISRLVEWLGESLEREKYTVRKWHLEIVDEKLKLEKESKDRQKLMKDVEARFTELEARREEIRDVGRLDTPIGTLPLSFHGILALIPFLTFLASSLLLHSQKRLLALRRQFVAAGPTDESTTDALQSTLPSLLDPTRSGWISRLVFACLSGPALIALFYAIQLFRIGESINANYAFNSVLLAVSTLLGIAIYSVAFFRLKVEWRGSASC